MPADDAGVLSEELAALRRWLVEAALPLWLAHGVDHARGGFFEALDLASLACVAPFRRLRVVARQVVVFSQAHALGVAGALAAVQLGLGFLERHAAQDDGGYAWRFDLAHRPIDLKRDLYDHAFVLLALASAAPVADTEVLRTRALGLLAWLDRDFTHAAGGYVESLPPALPRRQNPHMHLLEALLAAYAAFGGAVFAERAQALVDLFASTLFDAAAGALPEYFGDGWQVLRDDGVFLVEPGHHCEWAWLLHRAAGMGLRVPQDAGARLLDFVDRYGTDARGGLVDELGSDGRVLAAGARLWPQTERLRAEFLRADASEAGKVRAVRVLAGYLRPDGLWHERRGVDGALSGEAAPASSLYHLTGAILAVS